MCFSVVIKWTKTFGWRLKQFWAKLCTCNLYIKYHYYFTNCKCAWNNWYCKMIRSFITEWCATLNLFLQIGLRPIAILTFSVVFFKLAVLSCIRMVSSLSTGMLTSALCTCQKQSWTCGDNNDEHSGSSFPASDKKIYQIACHVIILCPISKS